MAKNNTDFEKLKPAGKKVSFNKEQLAEIYACHSNPIHFMENFMCIQHPVKGKMPFEAYQFQRELINTYWQNRNTIAMIPRQSGKCCLNSTIITVKQNSTGKQYDIPIGEYHQWASDMRDHGTSGIDINRYQKN
jgi:hypothetical protein